MGGDYYLHPELIGDLVHGVKGHAMAGFGGAIKNISIGFGSREGKCLIHTAGGKNTETETGGKTLVVYYSAQNHTEAVAQQIAQNLGADIFELVPVDEYTSSDLNWNDQNSRVTREYEDESLRDIELESTTVENWDEYDTVLIGYPIWWGIAAWPVDTFVKANDFNGKTVIPFCTSSSSGLGQSGELLAEEANGGNWLEGHRFRSNPSDSDIQEWTDSIQFILWINRGNYHKYCLNYNFGYLF